MIDEKRLIEEMKRTFPDKLLNDKNWFWGEASFMDLFEELVEEQPKVGEWIPCSERLPENEENVLTSVIVEGRNKIEIGAYLREPDEWFLFDEYYSIYSTKWEVIAWMPLPQPYKGE